MIRSTHYSRRTQAVGSARMRILEAVARRGPLPVADLHAGWPTTRHHTRILLNDLSREELLAFVRGSGHDRPLVAITDAGRALLHGGAADDP